MTGNAQKTVGEVFAAARLALVPVSQEEAAQQARLFLCHALKVSQSELVALFASPMPAAAMEALDELINRRLTGEPLQYIFGEWEFMGLPFFTQQGALIPRQDTETLAEHALSLIKERGYKTVLDLCCGTGCIGISLNKLSGITATLADISAECLMLAQKNAARNDVSASFLQGDLFSAVNGFSFDLIVCNPPYIPTGDLAALQKEVQFEPSLALDGGEDGLCFYRRIAQGYKVHLNTGGSLLLEVGIFQAEAVKALFENAYVLKDLCGVERVVAIQL